MERLRDRAEDVLRSRDAQIGLVLFVAAFAVRWMFAEHGFWIDEGRALMIAKNALMGNGFRFSPTDIMWKHPFMFYTLIAFSYLFFGVSALGGMVTTNVLGALTVVVVFLTGRELFNRWAGVAAAVLMMVDPVHMFYSTRVLTDVPGTFFVALTLYFWVRTEQRDETWSFYATFVTAALTLLTKLTGVVVLPALFIYYLWKEREQLFLKRKYWYALATTVGLYSIWEVRNLLTVGFIGIVETFLSNYLNLRAGGGGGGGGGLASGVGFVEGGLFHLTNLPTTIGVPTLVFLVAGAIFAYVYRDDRLQIPAIYLVVAFLVLSSKARNRYFLPFHPMAMVVAGYGIDRVRDMAEGWDPRAGHVALALILTWAVAIPYAGGGMFQQGAAMTQKAAAGFVGLDESGRWLQENSAEDAKVIAGSVHQMRFFSGRWVTGAGQFDSGEQLDAYVLQNGIDYVEVDRWEQTQPKAYVTHVQKSDAYRPVHAVRRNGKPVVVIYRVNRSALE